MRLVFGGGLFQLDGSCATLNHAKSMLSLRWRVFATGVELSKSIARRTTGRLIGAAHGPVVMTGSMGGRAHVSCYGNK
jgi:hypothetical protein